MTASFALSDLKVVVSYVADLLVCMCACVYYNSNSTRLNVYDTYFTKERTDYKDSGSLPISVDWDRFRSSERSVTDLTLSFVLSNATASQSQVAQSSDLTMLRAVK